MPAWLLALTLVPNVDVPVDVQLPAFLKALGFERNLEVESDVLRIGILYDPTDSESANTADSILETHQELTRMRVKGKRVELVPVAYERGRPLELAESKVLVAAKLPDEAIEILASRSGSDKVLTFSTTPSYVERGLAVGMEVANGRPGFVVNLGAVTEAGASFEASFLALCRIVER